MKQLSKYMRKKYGVPYKISRVKPMRRDAKLRVERVKLFKWLSEQFKHPAPSCWVESLW